VLGTGVKFGTEDAILRFVAGLSNHSKKKANGNRKARQPHLGSPRFLLSAKLGTRSLCFLLLPSNPQLRLFDEIPKRTLMVAVLDCVFVQMEKRADGIF
jgi:hypothetical protein